MSVETIKKSETHLREDTAVLPEKYESHRIPESGSRGSGQLLTVVKKSTTGETSKGNRMKFFEKIGTLNSNTGELNTEGISSIFAKDVTLTGEIVFKGKTRIEGKVEGNVRGEYLILSQTGRIHGDMELAHFVCQGEVEGNIKAKNLEIKKTAVINGRIETVHLSVDAGATLNSEVRAKIDGAKDPVPPVQPAKQELKTVVS